MAHPSYVESLLGSLPDTERTIFKRVFDYVLRNLQFGPMVHQTRTTNLAAYWLSGTTHATANTEFSIEHGLGRAPYLAMPAIPLNVVGAQMVPLSVSRAADAARVYLKSSSTGAAVWILVE